MRRREGLGGHSEFNAWSEVLADHVFNLLGDFGVVQRRKERESLEELVVDGSPHHHGGGLLLSSVGHEGRNGPRKKRSGLEGRCRLARAAVLGNCSLGRD